MSQKSHPRHRVPEPGSYVSQIVKIIKIKYPDFFAIILDLLDNIKSHTPDSSEEAVQEHWLGGLSVMILETAHCEIIIICWTFNIVYSVKPVLSSHTREAQKVAA